MGPAVHQQGGQTSPRDIWTQKVNAECMVLEILDLILEIFGPESMILEIFGPECMILEILDLNACMMLEILDLNA